MLLPILIALIVIESALIILFVIDRGMRRKSLTQQQPPGKQESTTPSQDEGFAGKLIRAHDQERQRISSYLHAEVGQQLSLLAIELDLLCRSLADAGSEIEGDQVSRLKLLIDEITSDIHCLSDQLYSAKLQHIGLHSAIRELSCQANKQAGVSINLNITDEILLPPDVALCAFCVIQEALNNVIQHSSAQSVWIDFALSDGTAHWRVEDDGSGFDLSAPKSGLGLQIMRERLRMMGGNFVVDSTLGEGTRIAASVPLKGDLSRIDPLLRDNAA